MVITEISDNCARDKELPTRDLQRSRRATIVTQVSHVNPAGPRTGNARLARCLVTFAEGFGCHAIRGGEIEAG